MSCPYLQSDCPELTLPPDAVNCPQCMRFLKSCPTCGTKNRSFANYCRACRSKFPMSRGNWLGYKGGVQRLGLNASSGPGLEAASWSGLDIQEKSINLQLGDSCRGLLGYDRHLIAVSQSGTIEICDPELPASGLRLKTDGPISCEPCIEDGILYLGSPGRLTAYSLGALTLASPKLTPLWQQSLSGTPVQALTALENRLYVNAVQANGRWEVQVFENLDRTPPSPGRVVHANSRISWMAADPEKLEVVFFSQEGEDARLLTIAHNTPRGEISSHQLLRIPRPFADNVPIAFLGGKIFGVFGDEERLCRIDARTGEFEQSLGADIKLFSLNRERERDWDGDGVQIDTNGIHFLRADVKEFFAPLDRVVKGSPVIVQGRAVVVGMQDGRLRIYDLLRLPRYESLRLTGDGEPITALASFRSYVAAGNVKGIVKVFELRTKVAAA